MTKELVARGMGASPGTATGQIVFHSSDAEALAAGGTPLSLLLIETTTQDLPGMK
jgi:pyruvate,orthophosphate dikinase